MLALATCQSQGPAELHTLELFFTLSHTLPLHDSHLNIGFLNAELQANWHEIKPTKWLIKFNLTLLMIILWLLMIILWLNLFESNNFIKIISYGLFYEFPKEILTT